MKKFMNLLLSIRWKLLARIIAGLSAILAIAGVSVLAYLTLMAKVPEMYRDYMRYEVGGEVVKIMDVNERSGGTGFHMQTKSGIKILTNRHICKLADKKTNELKVFYHVNGVEKSIIRKVIKIHDSHDLCLVEGIEGFDGLKIGSEPYIGQTTYIYGHPGLRPLTLSQGELIGAEDITLRQFNIKKEECTGTWTEVDPNKFPLAALFGINSICEYKLYSYHITNIIYGGNSGSPVVNFWGNVVGVVFAGNPRVITQGYMVPFNIVKEFVENN